MRGRVPPLAAVALVAATLDVTAVAMLGVFFFGRFLSHRRKRLAAKL